MVESGAFREDLWYRLSVFPIRIPPLRERTEDIEPLARAFAQQATRFGLAPCVPTAEDLAVLRAYPWPGNVRELAAVIDRAAILGRGQRLEIGRALGDPGPRNESKPEAPVITLREAIRTHLEAALEACGGRIEGPQGAAHRLDLPPATLRSKLRKLGVDPSRFRGDR
jgi:DNA-binding NtrC family response regulator